MLHCNKNAHGTDAFFEVLFHCAIKTSNWLSALFNSLLTAIDYTMQLVLALMLHSPNVITNLMYQLVSDVIATGAGPLHKNWISQVEIVLRNLSLCSL